MIISLTHDWIISVKGIQLLTSKTISLASITSFRDQDFDDKHRFEDSVLRLRIVMTIPETTVSMAVDGDTYWTEATVSFTDNYIYAARAGVTFAATRPDPYAGVSSQ